MNPDLIAEARAAITPQTKAAPTPVEPTAVAPGRRGRPPKKPDANYLAAKDAITGATTAFGDAPARAKEKRPYHRAVFKKLPAAPAGQPLDVEAARAIIKPRPGTTKRAWPAAPDDPKQPRPQLTPEELKQVVGHYLERYGPILSLDEAADVVKLSKQTLRRFVCEGCFANAVYRGRPLRFLTQRFIEEVLR
ncbi:MAG TPA: hypothetical protein VFB66_22595 [Tepidisphaeraceae bacterium]|nr:hypothetical protein [Tepidisphaeraceae bacterium]